MHRICFVIVALLFAMLPSYGQTRNTPLGFCSFTPTAATALPSVCGIPNGTGYALICAYNQNVNWRDDGPAPTTTAGTGGQQIASGNCIPYNGNFNAFQVIQQTATAIVAVTFYRPV